VVQFGKFAEIGLRAGVTLSFACAIALVSPSAAGEYPEFAMYLPAWNKIITAALIDESQNCRSSMHSSRLICVENTCVHPCANAASTIESEVITRDIKVAIPIWEPPLCSPCKQGVDSDAKCNPVDSIGSSTKSRISHSDRRPSARFPGDEDGSARENIEPLQ
jgi:hypothetical protein